METSTRRYVLLRRYGGPDASGPEPVAWFADETEALDEAEALAALDVRKRAIALACSAFEADYAAAFPPPAPPFAHYESVDPPPSWRRDVPRGERETTATWLARMGRTLLDGHVATSSWKRAFVRSRDAYLRAEHGIDWEAFADMPGLTEATSYEVKGVEADDLREGASEWFERFA